VPAPHTYGAQAVLPPSGSTRSFPLQVVHAPLLQTKPAAQSVFPAQRVLHLFVVASHTRFAGHCCGDPTAHLPLPSHVLSVSCPFAHTEPQLVPAAGYVHAVTFVPLHVPEHGPDPAHAWRCPCGAPLTAVHVPTCPPTSQASHSLVHAVSQHWPSTQKPLAHWSVAVHGLPVALFFTHVVPLQYASLAHCESDAHVASHAPPVQSQGSQLALLVVHVPEPLHICPVTLLFEQVVAPQTVPAFAVCWQPPAPSQVPSAPHGFAGLVGQLSWCGFVY
jgi:hypothetical protein